MAAAITRRAIMDACRQQLATKNADRITVTELVEACGINRNTFYYHFADLPALLEAIAQEELDDLLRENPPAPTLRTCYEAIVRRMQAKRQVALNLYRSSRRDAFEWNLFRVCGRAAERYVAYLSDGAAVPEERRRLVTRSCCCELFGHVMSWLEGGLTDADARAMLAIAEMRQEATRQMLLSPP